MQHLKARDGKLVWATLLEREERDLENRNPGGAAARTRLACWHCCTERESLG